MARLVVDFEALDRLQSAIGASIEVAEQDLQTLTGQVGTLADRWSGAAAEGFQRTVSDWLAARQDLQQQGESPR